MRALTLFNRVRSRHALPLALCAGVLALSGCPKMPRITPETPTPSASASTTPTPSPSPSASSEPEPTPTPADEPTTFSMTVGNAPQSLVLDAMGNGFATLAGDLVRIDGAIGNLGNAKTTSLKTSGYEIGSPSGILMLGSNLWFTDSSRKQIRVIREFPSDSKTTENFSFGEAPTRLVKDPQDNLWIADSEAAQVGLLKPDGFSSPISATLDGIPDDLVVDHQGAVWALVTSGDTVKIAKMTPAMNGSTPNGINVEFQKELTGLGRGVGLAFDDQYGLWLTGVSKGGLGQLMRIDLGTGSATADFNFENLIPARFAIRGGFAWIPDASPSGSQIVKVALSTGQIVSYYPIGGRGSGVFKDPTGDLWVPVGSGTALVKLDF